MHIAIEIDNRKPYTRPTATSRTLSLNTKSVKSSQTRCTFPFAFWPACSSDSPLSSRRGIPVKGMEDFWFGLKEKGMLQVNSKHLKEMNTSTQHSHKRIVACHDGIVGYEDAGQPTTLVEVG